MDKYIEQLIEEINAANQAENKLPKLQDDGLKNHFEEVEKYISGDYDQILGEVFGLTSEQFPPTEKLTVEQMSKICSAFTLMLYSWNISAEFPENLPVEIEYKLLVSVLERKTFIGTEGFVHFEFCNYMPAGCPFGEKFCSCKDFEEEDMNTFLADDTELPF